MESFPVMENIVAGREVIIFGTVDAVLPANVDGVFCAFAIRKTEDLDRGLIPAPLNHRDFSSDIIYGQNHVTVSVKKARAILGDNFAIAHTDNGNAVTGTSHSGQQQQYQYWQAWFHDDVFSAQQIMDGLFCSLSCFIKRL
jgi:hypothetical protein